MSVGTSVRIRTTANGSGQCTSHFELHLEFQPIDSTEEMLKPESAFGVRQVL
jgi:hypothetical protein